MMAISRAWSRARARLEAPVDPASLAVFRILFGLLGAIGAARFALKGWVVPLYVEPRIFFTWPCCGWVQPWSEPGLYVHLGVLFLAGLAIAVGFFTRGAAAVFFVAFTAWELFDKTNYLNHYYLVSLLALLLAVVPTDRWASLGAWRRAGPPPATPGWAVVILRFQVGVVYVFAGIAKLGSDWLVRAQPLRIWLEARSDVPLLGPLLGHPAAPWAFAWAGAAFDLTIVGWLLWPRTRRVACGVLVVFHLMTGLLFDIGLFPAIMTAAATIFLDPSWPRWWVGAAPWIPQASRTLPVSRGVWAFTGVWVLLQLLLPLRTLWIPGAGLWSEEGVRFAWKVMVMEKAGQVDLWVVTADGQRSLVRPEDWLTPRQVKACATQPDLILHLAHVVAADRRARGHPEVRVYADAWVSLNGRPRRRFIRPDVDLVQVRDGWGPRWWVEPLVE